MIHEHNQLPGNHEKSGAIPSINSLGKSRGALRFRFFSFKKFIDPISLAIKNKEFRYMAGSI